MKISRIFLYSALSAVTLLTGACDDDDNGYSYGDPKAVVSTPVAPVINATSADVEATCMYELMTKGPNVVQWTV